MKRLIFLYGGAFDPPHLGHLQVVRELGSHPWLAPLCASIQIIPTAQSKLKQHHYSGWDRFNMARLAFSDLRNVEVNGLELDREKKNPGQPTTTWDSVHELFKLESQHQAELCFVMGADQLEIWPKWFRFPEITGLCHWLILERKGTQGDALRKLETLGIAGTRPGGMENPWGNYPSERTRVMNHSNGRKGLALFPTDAPEISSTEIRRLLALGKKSEAQAVIPPRVWPLL